MKRRVLGVLLLTLLIAATSILPSASAYVGGSEQAKLSSTQPQETIYRDDLKADIFALANGNRLMLVTLMELELWKECPTKAYAPIGLINLGPNPVRAAVKEVVLGINGAYRAQTLNQEVLLEVVTEKPEEVLMLLSQHPGSPEANRVLGKAFKGPASVGLPANNLKFGDKAAIDIELRIESEGTLHVLVSQTNVVILQLPVRTYWHGGDGHIHSSWSPDSSGWTINDLAGYAADSGFHWVIVTDHEDGINENWPTYVAQCNNAQTGHGIVVAPGGEITASGGNGDALGYCLRETAATIPNNQTYTPQGLINAINNHNSPYSYAVIAHPYKTPAWTDWNVYGFRSIELLSYEYVASEEVKNKWFDLLRVNLADTIATGKFVVGVGNTDSHKVLGIGGPNPGDRGFSWVYTQDYQYYLRSSIWNAIRSGHVSASGRKDLGVFAVNGTVQGSVIKVSAQGQLQFRLVQQPVTGRKCTMVRIVDALRNPIRNIANPGTETYVTLSPPPNDTFYVVKFEFTATDGSEPSDVWCNPIFIDRI